MALSSTHRIRSSREIGDILRLGRRKKSPTLFSSRLIVAGKPWGLLVRVPAKTISKAVDRNLVRRKINGIVDRITKIHKIADGLRIVCTVHSENILSRDKNKILEEIKTIIQ